MKVLNNDFSNLKQIVNERAKYQKVMLIFDELTSEIEMMNIYEQIKDLCIFNKMEISDNSNEIYNGYKLLIFCVSVDSFLKFEKNIEEFTSVFITQNEQCLPFYLDQNCKISSSERYLLLNSNVVDINAVSSIHFNRFFSYATNLLYFQFGSVFFDFEQQEITQFNLLKTLDETSKSMQFIDIQIIKEQNISYTKLNKLNFILICAFLTVINAIATKSFELVDFYKACKNEVQLIDKFYAMQTNQAMLRMVELNYNFLQSSAIKTKEKIICYLNNVSQTELQNLVSKIKEYSKTNDGLIGYLYLYNIFGC